MHKQTKKESKDGKRQKAGKKCRSDALRKSGSEEDEEAEQIWRSCLSERAGGGSDWKRRQPWLLRLQLPDAFLCRYGRVDIDSVVQGNRSNHLSTRNQSLGPV